ncbi:OprO/OprP family phosphate-selective porin [Zhouia spongiae]|uniref:OprO/OprP family phosphate-selective porin n=1 Tax=Zhouia spongiae TaxID=2202721 RepID=A0ABY3YP25_9FLAO|nr:porin [Zhouia spongiae]UNY99570.1 OprO/OprP family phosphate-selective porin [Zhouia spongiae]
MKLKFLVLVLCVCLINITQGQEVKAPEFGKGILNITGKDNSWSMKLGARIQMLSVSEWTNDDGNIIDPNSNFSIRRARIKMDGFAFSPTFKYKIELGLSNRDIAGASIYTRNTPRYILDAVVKWNFYENFTLWAGQTKLPGNVERVISSANMQLVDRSILNATFNIDRDLGLQLRHHTNFGERFVMREIFSVAQGEGRNVVTGNIGGYQYTGRLEFLPLGLFENKGDYTGGDLNREETPKLMIGASYDFNNNAVKTRSNQGSYMETDNGFHETNVTTFFADLMFKYKGFSVMAEFANRDADDPYAKNSDGTLTGDVVQIGNGVNVQGGYLLKSNWEVSARYSNIELDKAITGKEEQNQYTLGLSKYIAGHKLKVQTDLSYMDIANINDQLMWRLQLDVHF